MTARVPVLVIMGVDTAWQVCVYAFRAGRKPVRARNQLPPLNGPFPQGGEVASTVFVQYGVMRFS